MDLTAPIAANADPATSHESAERATRSGARRRHAEIVLQLVRHWPGLTAVELHARQSQLERHEVSRRLADLERAGLVHKGPPRKCVIAGTSQSTWIAGAKQETLFG